MNIIRPRALLAAVLVLVISACSQTPLSPTSGTLTPQFGTPDSSSVYQLAVNESGIYLGGRWNGKPSLIKFSRAGGIPWLANVAGGPVEVALDSRNNAYILFYSLTDNAEYFIRKYAQNGTLVWQRQLVNPTGAEYPYYAADVDAQNNLYLSIAGFDDTGKTELRKYRPDGSLLYSKQVAGSVNDLAVAPDGTMYTASETQQQLTRYTPQGQRVWQKALPMAGNEVAVGTSSQIYVAGHDPSYAGERILLAKYSSSGNKSWQRVVREGFVSSLRGLGADKEGNVFTGVGYRDSPRDDEIVYLYSYNALGRRLVERVVDVGYQDSELSEIGVVSATEVYLGGVGYNGLGHEGFLTRLNGLNGNVTWRR